MVDFGEEMVILDSYRVPWLIWIQILVFFLLLLLLYAFGLLSYDLSDSFSSSPSSDSGVSVSVKCQSGDPIPENNDSKFVFNSSRLQSNEMGESESLQGKIALSAETRRVAREEDTMHMQGEGSSQKDSFCSVRHPCQFVQFVKSAFLKCLGLDRMAEDSQRSGSKKER